MPGDYVLNFESYDSNFALYVPDLAPGTTAVTLKEDSITLKIVWSFSRLTNPPAIVEINYKETQTFTIENIKSASNNVSLNIHMRQI